MIVTCCIAAVWPAERVPVVVLLAVAELVPPLLLAVLCVESLVVAPGVDVPVAGRLADELPDVFPEVPALPIPGVPRPVLPEEALAVVLVLAPASMRPTISTR